MFQFLHCSGAGEDLYDEYSEYNEYDEYEEYASEQWDGSASEVEGTTVIVSIFANDLESCWTENDANLMYDMKNYMGIACDWITDQVASYGTNVNFIYDWEQHENLYYEADIDYTVLSGNDDERMMYGYECVDGTIDSNTIMSNYSADNIIYMIFIKVKILCKRLNVSIMYYREFFEKINNGRL